jgi:Dolichyl-phosphate-mannose-protein mannosyltransferase
LNTALKSRLSALLCVFALLLCSLAAYPVAEIGMNDDWSYIKSARVLAQTGHIVYNGWATAMLGWQLLLGALFIKFFGPSFTAVRASTLLVALATAFLVHRTFVRAGVSSRNATVGTLCLVLSPLFLPLALSFMTDVGGLFCIILCLYACLRTLQASTDRAQLSWLAFAALSNALGGTVRQIAWLGVLVMVPSTVWLLRRRPRVVLSGAVLYAVSAVFIFGCLRWFEQQPYSVPVSLIPGHINPEDLSRLVSLLSVSVFSCGTFLLPILLAFVPTLSKRNLRAGFLILGGALCLTTALFISQRHTHNFTPLLAPHPGNYVTEHGLVDTTSIKGMRPTVLNFGFRIALTISVYVGLYSFWAFLYTGRPIACIADTPPRIAGKSLLVLLVPFTVAYFPLLLPPGLTVGFFDRYLLPLLFMALVLVLRLFEDRVHPNLPLASFILTLLFAAYAVAGTHDAFSMFRAEAAAFAELRAAGIPAISIDGGFEQNGMTQIESVGYMNNGLIRVPPTVYLAPSSHLPEGCEPQLALVTPTVIPRYSLSFDPSACGGLSRFAPVTYRNWLWPNSANIYIVDSEKAASSH